ncbi:ABC-type bacteriocin/lantibiotic exporter with double-glycine peptidase domain [Paenibacillus castaneae]|uniref:ABC transporter ATP-binding protein n=1 Tax=Paenibacillus castaneae TaxID=474957 RepID=UPI000C9B616E|nr:ABC transporter ATP-binding protein [Paenibacillus castaneae]NIK78868.1 ABC-type bacteriocin/lantibiotic exporter with double-glycine peptidase domain [Paenibacillus castaneae]
MNENLSPALNNRKVIMNYVRANLAPRRGNLYLIIMKNILGSLLFMIPPFLSKYVLESVLPQQNWNLLLIVTIGMVAAPITGSMMIILENVWGRFLIRLSASGRADMYNGIQHQSMDWLRNRRIGDLLTRVLDDTRLITDMVNGHLGFMIFHIVTIISGSVILLVLKPALGAIVLLLWALQAVLMSILGPKVKRQAAETAKQNSQVSDTVRELVTSASFIKATGQEKIALGHVKDCLNQEWEHTRKSMRTTHLIRMVSSLLNAAVLVLMYAAGGWFVLGEQMTIGSLVAFIAVYNWLRPFGVSFIEMVLDVIRAVPAVNRITDICFPIEPKRSGFIPEEALTLEVNQVSFHYEDRLVLRDVTLRIAQGSILSIVGHRGSGKSTLAELLLGLRDPDSGYIGLNSIPLNQIDASWYRSSVLAITQDIMLRSGTILDNILYGSKEHDLEKIWEAIRLAELEEWITALPKGLYTSVGERAWQISGGERQRISIARALLRRPAILILDEATSSLDQRTERRLLDRIIQQLKGTTLIFITHRLDVALRSDHILVMDNGQITAQGTHEELVSHPGLYAELWSEQR